MEKEKINIIDFNKKKEEKEEKKELKPKIPKTLEDTKFKGEDLQFFVD